jgi:hypothetical protein
MSSLCLVFIDGISGSRLLAFACNLNLELYDHERALQQSLTSDDTTMFSAEESFDTRPEPLNCTAISGAHDVLFSLANTFPRRLSMRSDIHV